MMHDEYRQRLDTHPRSERFAYDLIVVKRPVSTLPDGLGLHAVESDRLAALEEHHHVSISDQGCGRCLICVYECVH